MYLKILSLTREVLLKPVIYSFNRWTLIFVDFFLNFCILRFFFKFINQKSLIFCGYTWWGFLFGLIVAITRNKFINGTWAIFINYGAVLRELSNGMGGNKLKLNLISKWIKVNDLWSASDENAQKYPITSQTFCKILCHKLQADGVVITMRYDGMF